MKLLNKINKNIKIYLILIPRYYKVEQQHYILLKDFREEFNTIIAHFKESYNFHYWDMKNLEEISKNRWFYHDTAHLNYYGGLAFTSFLNDRMKNGKGK